MKVAVASKDGISVNVHFGHASRFLIYDIVNGLPVFLETRHVDHYCHGQHGDMSALAKILETIRDCSYCLVAKIGEGPKEKLAKIGIEADERFAYESVQDSLHILSSQT